MLSFDKIRNYPNQLVQWIQDELILPEVLIQLGVSFGLLLLASMVTRVLYRQLEDEKGIGKYLRADSLQTVVKDCFMPTIWLTLLTFSVFVLEYFLWEAPIIKGIITLLVAWVCLRIISSFVKNNVFSRFIAITAWGIAALSILGLLQPMIEFLDGLALNFGELRISLLTVLKGIITLGVFMWGALALSRLADRQIRGINSLTPSLQVLLVKLLRILLITFAILIGLSSAGIDVTALAVFSGAVGVGIGFGLQKIVSNFISGVILLMDRSIKPGDVIEVDDTYGWINKLSGRHVSVITRDGKEHLIPNEDLITNRVINWSYSSKSVRIRVPIGIAYECDPAEARAVILEAAKEVPRVIDSPTPVCLMLGFGDSSVNLELRVWIRDPANGVNNVRSQILFKVWEKFKEHNISIPFPQRDVHLDFPEDLQKLLEKSLGKQGSAT